MPHFSYKCRVGTQMSATLKNFNTHNTIQSIDSIEIVKPFPTQFLCRVSKV